MFKRAFSLVAFLVVSQSPAFGSDDSVAIEEHLLSLISQAATTVSNPSATPQEKKDASQTSNFATMAKEINAMQVSLEQKNRQCHFKAKGLAEIMYFDVGSFVSKCDDVFK